jgi:hypothetical protein
MGDLVFGIFPGWVFGLFGLGLAIMIPVLFWPRKKAVPRSTVATSLTNADQVHISPASPPHRHNLKLTWILVSATDIDGHPWREAVSGDIIAWQCHCGIYAKKSRIKLKEEMMPRWANPDQVWPG